MTAGQSRHNALLTKIQAVGRGLYHEELKHSAVKAFGKTNDMIKHNVQSAECFNPAVMQTVPLAESILKAEHEAAHCRRNMKRHIAA